MSKRIELNSHTAARAIGDASEGRKSDLQFLLAQSEVRYRPELLKSPRAIEAVVVTPTHRESSVALLQSPLLIGTLSVVHINDHPLGLHEASLGDRFYTRVRVQQAEVDVVDGIEQVISMSMSYGGYEPPPTVIKKVMYGDKAVEREYALLGPLLKNEDGWLYYIELFGPFSLLAQFDIVLNGRMRNMLLKEALSTHPANVVVIDSSHIRELTHEDERPHSIGRARALPIEFLNKKSLPPETPVFWNDADTYFEPGALEAATQYYKDHPEILGVFFSRRTIFPNAELDVFQIQKHAGSELVNAVRWLTERKLHYMGGPQISSRLGLYNKKVEVTSPYCKHCDEDHCSHKRPTYTSRLVDALANIPNDEDFAFADILLALSKPEQSVVWLPQRVWVNNRGRERKDITAVNGDAGNDMHEYPDLLGSYKGLVPDMILYLGTKGISVQANDLQELINCLITREDFQIVLDNERNIFTTHGLANLGPQPHDKLYSYYGEPQNRLEKAIRMYALQTYLLGLET